jgi:putative membrane protein
MAIRCIRRRKRTSYRTTGGEAVEEQESRTIIKLGLVDLLKIGLTQNHLKSGGVALGGGHVGLWFQIRDVL